MQTPLSPFMFASQYDNTVCLVCLSETWYQIMDQEIIKEAFSDEEFVKSLEKIDTPAKMVEAFASKGIETTEEEIIQLAKFVSTHADELQNGELSEEDLENVSGGFALIFGIATLLTAAGVGAGFGAFIGAIKTVHDKLDEYASQHP